MKMPNIRGLIRAAIGLLNLRLVHAHKLAALESMEEGLIKMKEFHADLDQGGSRIMASFQEDPAASLYIAAAFAHMINGAENYREIAFTPNMAAQAKLGCDFVTVTIQKHGRLTPHQARQDAEYKLARLQYAVATAAKPFANFIEWLGPENKGNNVNDTDPLVQGATRIDVGDARRVAALLNHPAGSTLVRIFDQNGEKHMIEMAEKITLLIQQLNKELRKPGAYKQRGYLIDLGHLIGAHMNTITRQVLGEKAPVYDPAK